MSIPKTARVVKVAIPLNPDLEDAFLEAQTLMVAAIEELIRTFPQRVAARLAERGIDPLDQEAREPVAAEIKAEDEDLEKEVAGRAEAALQAVVDTTRTFKFRSLGRTTYRKLIAAHPPTDADHTAARVESGDMNARASWNRETFFPALVHAASVGPQLTEAEVVEIFESPDWSDGEVDLLVQGAIKAQISTSQIA